jgi:dienelactone hydrolase
MFARILAAAAAIFMAASSASAETDLAAAFGAREQLEQVSLSPDGTRLAYIVPTKGQGSALLTITPGKDAKPAVALVTTGDPDRLSDCHWISNERLICTLWGLAENATMSSAYFKVLPFSRVIAVDAAGGNPRMLSKATSSYSRDFNLHGGDVIDWLPDEDGMVLMTRNQLADDRLGTRLGNSKGGFVVDKVNTRTMSTTKMESPREGAFGYISDGRGTLRIMAIELIEGDKNVGLQRYYYRTVGSREWLLLSEYDYANNSGFRPVAVDYERNAAYGFRKLDGRDAVYRVALDGSKHEELVLARPDADIDDLIYVGRRRRVIGASFVTDVRQAVYFDADLAKLRNSLGKALPNQPQVRIVDASNDEKKLLIRADSDNDPGVYYVLDRTTREMATFQPIRPQLEGLTLGKVQPIAYPAADGSMIPGYLTLAPGSTGKKLPAIVLPHGGPNSRDEWNFNWLAQYFVARGFAVLQPNFRGSAGSGGDTNDDNGYKAWRVAIGDVVDAGRWLVKQGIADPAKLGIVGWSYGGYAALQSAVMDPTLFKAVVAIAPVTDLPLRVEKYRHYTNYRLQKDYVGTGAEALAGSPARNAARIRVPVLLVHGTYDNNVDFEHSRLMDSRLNEASVAHQLIVFDKLDHQLEDSAARAKLLSESDAFLRKSMGM